MKKLFEGLEKLIHDPNTSEETKEAIKKLLEDEIQRQQSLAEELEKIIKHG